MVEAFLIVGSLMVLGAVLVLFLLHLIVEFGIWAAETLAALVILLVMVFAILTLV